MARHSISSNYELVLTLSQRTQSIANNNSIVRARYSVRKLSGSGYWDTTQRPFNLYVNGNKVVDSTITFDFRRYSELVLWEGDITVPHNNDGSKTVSASGYFNGDRIGSGTVNESLKLVDIPRKSSFTVPGSFIMGNPLPVSITRAVARFKHKVSLTYKAENNTYTILSQSNIDTNTTLPMTEAQIKTLCETIPNELKRTVSIVVETFDGSKSLGSVSTPVVANVPSSVVPTVTGIAKSWLNGMDEVPGFNGEIYKDFTKITFNPSGALGMYGSTIESSQYKVSDFSDFRFTKIGTKSVTLTVTDSRGRTASTTTTVNVLEITLPKLSVSWIRCNTDGTPNPFGVHARLAGSINGAGSFFLDILSKVTGTSTWHRVSPHKVPRMLIKDAFNVSGNIEFLDPEASLINPIPISHIGIDSVDSDKTYDVQIRLQHRFWQWCDIPMGSVVQDILATTKVALDVGVENIGVGKIYTGGRGSIDAMHQIFQNDGIPVANGPIGTLPSGNCNLGSYWKNMRSGTYWSGDGTQLTNSKGNWSIVQVFRLTNEPGGNNTRVLWFVDGGTVVNGSVNSGDTMVWRTQLDTANVANHVVEQGSNYRKWSNGIMEQWELKTISPAIATNVGIGPLFRNASTYVLTFPIPFINDNVVVTPVSFGYATASMTAVSRTAANVQFVAPRNVDTVNAISYVAIGRWM